MKAVFLTCLLFTLVGCQGTPSGVQTQFRAELPVDGVLTFGQ